MKWSCNLLILKLRKPGRKLIQFVIYLLGPLLVANVEQWLECQFVQCH